MERKGNEKDHIAKVIMPEMLYSGQKIKAGHAKLPHFVMRFSPFP
jgi:hypothetical protein